MWFLLLAAIEGGLHTADSVYPSLEECLEARSNQLDVCVEIEIQIVRVPEPSPIVTTPLDP